MPKTYMNPNDGTLQKAAQAALDLHQFEDYAGQADALLRGCVKQEKQP